jgi:hypothetical protein
MVLGRSIIPPEHFLGKSAQKRAYAPKLVEIENIIGLFQKKSPKTRCRAIIVEIENIIGLFQKKSPKTRCRAIIVEIENIIGRRGKIRREVEIVINKNITFFNLMFLFDYEINISLGTFVKSALVRFWGLFLKKSKALRYNQ